MLDCWKACPISAEYANNNFIIYFFIITIIIIMQILYVTRSLLMERLVMHAFYTIAIGLVPKSSVDMPYVFIISECNDKIIL